MKLYLYILLFILCFAGHLQSQNKLYNVWYFGINAGLDFNGPGDPRPLTSNFPLAREGTSVICDSNGVMIMFCNGIDLYDRNHNIMKNGDGLHGDNSSAMNSIIFPVPGSNGLYYVFVVDAIRGSRKTLTYNIVDIKLNAGLGEVVQKNVTLLDDVFEYVSAVKLDNSYILLTARNNTLYAYRIDKNGISKPLLSAIPESDIALGWMAISPDLKKIAISYEAKGIKILDFDISTGKASNGYMISRNKMVYGVEFSSNSRYLYVTDIGSRSELLQFDLEAGSPALVDRSKLIVFKMSNLSKSFGALRRKNNKIYAVTRETSDIYVVHEPDKRGDSSDVRPVINLGKAQGYWGLPNYPFENDRIRFVYLSIPDTSSEAGDTISIPIYAYMPESDCNGSYRLKISMPYDLISLDADFLASVEDYVVDDSLMTFTITGSGSFSADTILIGYIRGMVLLANNLLNEIKIEVFESECSNIQPVIDNGSLTITGVCEPDIRKIEPFDALELRIYPNPSSNNASLYIRSEANRNVELKIIGALGTISYSSSYISTGNDRINLPDLPSGVYAVIVSSLGQVKKEKISIIK